MNLHSTSFLVLGSENNRVIIYTHENILLALSKGDKVRVYKSATEKYEFTVVKKVRDEIYVQTGNIRREYLVTVTEI